MPGDEASWGHPQTTPISASATRLCSFRRRLGGGSSAATSRSSSWRNRHALSSTGSRTLVVWSSTRRGRNSRHPWPRPIGEASVEPAADGGRRLNDCNRGFARPQPCEQRLIQCVGRLRRIRGVAVLSLVSQRPLRCTGARLAAPKNFIVSLRHGGMDGLDQLIVLVTVSGPSSTT